MRTPSLIVVAFLALSLPGFGRQEESLDALKARAESARLDQQPALYVEIAQRQLESANQLYDADNAEAARADVADVVTYSDKASDAALRSGKKLKQTEISMRKMASRLRAIKRSLAFEEQATVQAAADHLEKLRTELLAKMFPKKETP